jgi:hypothetical protein
MHPLLQCSALLEAAFEKYLVRYRARCRWDATAWARGEQVVRWRELGYTHRKIGLLLGLSRNRCQQIEQQHRQRRARALRSFVQLMQARLASG